MFFAVIKVEIKSALIVFVSFLECIENRIIVEFSAGDAVAADDSFLRGLIQECLDLVSWLFDELAFKSVFRGSFLMNSPIVAR